MAKQSIGVKKNKETTRPRKYQRKTKKPCGGECTSILINNQAVFLTSMLIMGLDEKNLDKAQITAPRGGQDCYENKGIS